MPASRLVRPRFEGRPVVRTPAAPGPALASHRGEPARWLVRRPVEHVCTAAAPPPRVVRLPRVPRVRATPRNLADLLVASARRARRLLRRLRPRAPQPPLLLQSLPTAPARRFAMVNAGSTPVPNPPSPPPSTLLARSAAPPRRSAPSPSAHPPAYPARARPAVRHAPLPSHPNCRPCSRLSPLSPPILFAPLLAPIPLPSISALSAGRLPSDTYTPQLEFGHSSYVMSSLDWSIYRPGYL